MANKPILKSSIAESIFDTFFEGLADNYNKLLGLNAIWLEKPLQTSQGRKRRIAPNDMVKVENGQLIDCNDAPSHKIIEVKGNLANTVFEIKLLNLSTNEVQTIQL